MLPTCLPSLRDLVEAPERAHLAMLRTAAALASRALVLEHGELGADFPPATIGEQPTLLVATLLLGRLDELACLIDWYDVAVEHLVSSQRRSQDDLPF